MEEKDKTPKLGRRDILKGIITLPVIGAIAYGALRKRRNEQILIKQIRDELNLNYEPPVIAPNAVVKEGSKLRIGIIGYGIRGEQLLRAAGFAQPAIIDEYTEGAKKDANDKRLVDFLEQDDLGIIVTGVCDLFDLRAQKAMAASANLKREGKNGKFGEQAKRFKTYKDLIASPDIDAVIIATPDHWHAPIAMEAAKAGKHVYVEKCMTHNLQETYDLRKIVKDTGIVFQLGHQGRQTESYIKAKEAIDKNVLGKINLIEVCTNRNSPDGAWVYDIDPAGNPHTIDWEQFLGNAPAHAFSLERFFRWRCWWDYGTGLAGDLLTHEFDAMNQMLGLGIPHSAVATGGVYYYKDGRDVPDVFQVAFEYPERDFTLLYSATLASDRDRGKMIMGHDGYMTIADTLNIYADPESTRYNEKIEKGIIDPEKPIYTYIPGRKNVDAVTSATERYFASRGLLYTYRGGKRVDTTHLHIKEWLDGIRSKTQPSCNIDQGFQEAITAHMSTLSLKENRRVFWDAEKQKVV
jgi:predicted dehydrogenase